MDQAVNPTMVIATTNDQWQDQRMQRWCRTLVECGWNVHWLGVDRGRPVPLANTDRVVYERLRIVPGSGPFFYTIFNCRLLLRALTLRPHAFLSVDVDTLPAFRLASLFLGKSLWFDAHEWFTEVPELLNRPVTRKIWRFMIHLFLRGKIQCLTVGSELASILTKTWGKPFEVLRNMPNLPLPSTEKSHAEAIESNNTLHSIVPGLEGPYLLYQGALNLGRGLESLLEAAALGLPYPLVIAGSGDREENLQAWVKDRKLEKKVRFTGPLDPSKLLHLTNNAFLGFNLLETRSQSYYYSLANKFFDYVQAGLPQVCMDYPEYRHHMALHRVGWLIQNTDPSLIVQCCRRIAEDPDAYRIMRENCHRAAAEWNWEHESAALKLKLTKWRDLLQPIKRG
jgi:glycosyltransferase involved in cell wall biosynthesis